VNGPEPAFEILGAEPVAHAAAPTLRFRLRVADPSGLDVHAIALGVQLQLEPARRRYDDATRARLVDLFGTPERWGATTTRSFLWAQLATVVPAFTGEAAFTVDAPCTYDLEVAAAKYLYSLPDGEAPLAMHFSGTILFGDLQIAMVPWSCTASWRLPIDTWREMMAAHYPGGGWVRLESSTLDKLAERKARDGLPSFDATVAGLLDD
jgi:hypothetical protein